MKQNGCPGALALVSAACLFASLGLKSTAAAQNAPAGATILTAPHALDWESSAGGKQQFEVASIHPTPEGVFTPPTFPMSNDDSYTAGPNETLDADFPVVVYIEFAYKLRLSPDQRKVMLAGAPKWITDQRYAIRAKAAGPVSKDQLRMMMQSLLADRFGLAVHFESREAPVLALTLAKPGQAPTCTHTPTAPLAVSPTTRPSHPDATWICGFWGTVAAW